jgi:hypothetical protein
MNSTYLECCDKFFGQKGRIALYNVLFFALSCYALLWLDFDILDGIISDLPSYRGADLREAIIAATCIHFILLFCIMGSWWMARNEIFRYTHYPMRFNRKTRMVHFFRFDGTTVSEAWNKVFFAVSPVTPGSPVFEVRAHCLSEDGKTVRDTFLLPNQKLKDSPFLLSQWEFIRRYMEEGPEKLIGQVHTIHAIDKRREYFGDGFVRLLSQNGTPDWLDILFAPLTFIETFGRYIAMHTSKIPVWPDEIEAQCQIEQDDPYILDSGPCPPSIEPPL